MATRGVNKVILLGNVGQDPEVRFTQNNVAIANVSLATSESWKDQSGQTQERTEWHRVVMYRRLAEIVGEYVKKGSKIYIEGKLSTRKWQDKDGKDRYTTEIIADEMQMLDSRPSGGDYQGGGRNYQQGNGGGYQGNAGGGNYPQGGGGSQGHAGGGNFQQGSGTAGYQGGAGGGGHLGNGPAPQKGGGNYQQGHGAGAAAGAWGAGQGGQGAGNFSAPAPQQGGGTEPALDFDDDIPF